MNSIIDMIKQEAWNDALSSFLEYSETHPLRDEQYYIVGSTLMIHYCQWSSAFSLLTDGLNQFPSSYELYLLLGDYYSPINTDQAYLSYENALYHSIGSVGLEAEDTQVIQGIINDFKSSNHITANNVSFVILSYNTLDYTKICIESIRDTCLSDCYEIIVVDNASNDGSVEWLREQKDIVLIENSRNNGFPKGCNQGIEAACKNNDIFLLNNDTIMLPGSLFWLRMGLYNDSKTGAAGSVTNYAINGQAKGIRYNTIEEYIEYGTSLNIPTPLPYELKSFLVMFAMIIKREALDSVGLLDEVFTPGNYEDNDYGIRLICNGYNSVLCHNSYIYHFGSKSFRSDMSVYRNLLETNKLKFKKKWGFDAEYYTHSRNDVIELINEPSDKSLSILEIGCGLGETLARIKYLYPDSELHGIEIAERIASIGNNRFDIRCGDIEKTDLNNSEKYDYIIFADVLEHLVNPEALLHKIKPHINDNGYIIASIPNIMNASVIRELLAGNFTYKDAGILDRTHLRFFTLNEIKRLFERTDYRIIDLKTTIMPKDSTDTYKEFFECLLKIDGVAPRESFDAYQYIIKAAPVTKK